ncbi:MAG: hypothetical protein KAI15_07015 [Gammaproteobacteria bacterium]|nr:hypothetical protein [Gammaproteobacteria bacterium]
MTNINTKETKEQEPNETAHDAALKSIEGLFEEAIKQAREVRPPELEPDALKAVKCYNKIKTALMTPTINNPLQKGQSWNLPELNETARKQDSNY